MTALDLSVAARGRWRRSWDALATHGWLPDNPWSPETTRSVFENFTAKTAVTMSLACLPLPLVLAIVSLHHKGNAFAWTLLVVPPIWFWLLAAFGGGKRERSTGVVAGASMVTWAFAGGVAFALLTGLMTPLDAGFATPWVAVNAALLGALPAALVLIYHRKWKAETVRLSAEQARAREAARERERQEYALSEARLQVLQAQIEPHFLFNALSHLQSLIDEDPPRAAAMAAAMARYVEQVVPRTRDGLSTVGDELELARAYLDIMTTRMGPRLRYAVDADPRLLPHPFPSLVLATLIENAIKHGIEPRREGGRIGIGVRRADRRLMLDVRDDGAGFGAAAVGGSGVGLANTRARLAALYGEDAGLDIDANAPHGVIAQVWIPLETRS
jgi:two-component sensor histidine kinase